MTDWRILSQKYFHLFNNDFVICVRALILLLATALLLVKACLRSAPCTLDIYDCISMCSVVLYCSNFTSQRLRVMGFILNSFTSPKSWYIYSKQLSICSHKGREIQTSVTWIIWKRNWIMVTEWRYQQTSLCSQCQTSNVGFLSASTVSWDSVYCICQINKAIRISKDTKDIYEKMFVPVVIPLGNWGHLV